MSSNDETYETRNDAAVRSGPDHLSRRNVLRGGAGLGALLVAGRFLSACAPASSGSAPSPGVATSTGGSATGAPSAGGRLTMTTFGQPTETLRVFFTQSESERLRNRMVCDVLGYLEGSELVGVLVASIVANEDGTEWKLTVREEATFVDGSPVTGEDVLFTLKAISDPDIADGLANGAVQGIDLDASSAEGKTVTLVLPAPLSDLDAQLYAAQLPVIQKTSDTKLTLDTVVTSGAFAMEGFEAGRTTLLSARHDYWGTGLVGEGPKLDEVELFTVADAKARMDALLGGQVKYAIDLNYAGVEANQGRDDIKFVETDVVYSTGNCFIMNSRLKPFDDPEVRRAFKLACNRAQLVDSALLGRGQVGNDLWGPGQADYNDSIPQREHDPERARAILQEAGVMEVPVVVSGLPGLQGSIEGAQLYVQQLQSLGLNVSFRQITADDLFTKAPDFTNLQILSTAIRAQPFATLFVPRTLLSTSTFNVGGWLREDWDQLYRDARAATDAAERKRLMDQVQSIFWEESGWIIWGHANIVQGHAPGVAGVEPAGNALAPSVLEATVSA